MQMFKKVSELGAAISSVVRAAKMSYAAGSRSSGGRQWSASSAGPNLALLGSLFTMISRSRDAYRNNPWIERAVEKNVVNEVGLGITPIFSSKDNAFNESAAYWWPEWVAQSDPSGALSFYGQLTQAVRGRRISGEMFIRRRHRPASWGLSIPFQLQLIESEQVPLTLNERRTNGNRIVAGKEYDTRGRFVALWIYAEHPKDGQYLGGSPIRVPSVDIIHHYLPLRPGQVRGEPSIVQGLLRAKIYDSYERAELIRKETRAPFTGFLSRKTASVGQSRFDPLTGSEYGEDEVLPEINAEPGTIIEGGDNESLTLFDGDVTGSGYGEYQLQQLRAIAAGCGSLYELATGDYSKINDRTYRAMIQQYYREIEMAQDQLCIHQICERVGYWFTDAGVLVNKLPVNNYGKKYVDYNRREWSPHRQPHIHPTQDVAATKARIDANLTTLDEEVAKGSGKRAADVQKKNVEAKARQQKYESDAKLNNVGDE